MSNLKTVVIVGRMNVGKSTLFNRLSEEVKSLTLDYAGVTRDFIKDRVIWNGTTFELVDTGGISLRKTQDILLEKVRQTALAAVERADLVLFVVDGAIGLLPEDHEVSTLLHRHAKKTILVINKADSHEAQARFAEFFALNHKAMVPISAQHGTGINDLLDMIIELLPKQTSAVEEDKSLFKVVFLGKPNVGKSSLMNAILQEERSIVSEIPGTTREAVTERISFYKEHIDLTDTPGIRRKRSVSGELEPLMVKSSFQALKNTDIVVLLMDASEAKLADQELKLAFYGFTDHFKALILLLNKTDLVTEVNKQDLERNLDFYKHIIKKIPVLQISCKTGKNVGRVMSLINKVWGRYSQQLSDEEINRLFISSLQKKPLLHSGELLHVHKVRQLKTAPITIGMEVNEPDWFGPSQCAFFENLLRDEYDLVGVPIRFVVRKKL